MNLRNFFRFVALACACLCGAVASAQVTRFVVTEAGGNDPVGTTPIKAGTAVNLRVRAVDADGNAVADYAQQVTLAFAELRRPSSGPWGASSGWAQVAIPATAFVGGVADNIAITVKHAGTGDRRVIVTDGNIATYDAAGLFSVAPASYQVTLSGNNYALGSIPHLLGRSIPVRVRALNSDGSVAEGFQGAVTLSSNAGTPTFSPVVAMISSHGVVDGVPLTPTILATGDTVNASDVPNGGMTTTAAASSTFNVVSPSSGNGLAGERLQISNVQVSNSVTPGGPANVSFTATNPGTGLGNPPIPVPGPIDFLIEAYNSDGLLVASSVIQRSQGVGGSSDKDTSVSISGTLYMPDTSAGTFNIMVHAGLNGNVGQGPLTIDKLSDLSITRFDYTPGEYRGGDAVRFDLVWTNLETAPTPNIAYLAEIRLSANDKYGDEDDFLVWSNTSRAQGAPEVLRTGQSQVVSDEFLLPKNIPGSYYLIAKVNGIGGRTDTALAFAEVRTPNNVTAGGLEASKITLLPIQASETTRVSLTTAGAQTEGIAVVSDRPVISQNGRYVAFHSYAPLDPTVTTSNIANVFFRDTLLNLTTLVSLSSFNGAANGSSMYPRMSADGRYVVYQSAATNLLPSDTNGYTDIFITDLSGASSVRTRRILPSETTQANQGAFLPDISADGRFIVFESTSTNLVSGVNTGVKQIFLYDRDVSGSGAFDSVGNTRVTLVSKTAANVAGTAASTSPRISQDGAYVVFTTRAPNLIAPGSSPFAQIVRWERATGALVTVSRSAGNVLADGEAGFPVINADGSYVVYASRAKNLTAEPTVTGVPHLFRARVVAGSVTEVVRINGAGGVELNNPATGSFAPDLGSLEPAISDDGSIVAFASESTNVLPSIPVRHIDRTEYLSGIPQHYLDDNAAADVYVANLSDPLSPVNMRISVSSFGYGVSPGTPTPQNRAPAMSGDGRYIAFTSDSKGMSGLVFGASNLDPVATNSAKDVYVFDAKSGLAPAPTDQPAVTLTLAPTLTVPSNTILSLTAEITNASRQIAQVEFYADGLLVATATAPSVVNGTAYAANWDLSALGLLATKTYEVAAIAVDVGGLRSPMSNVSEVTVRPIVGLVPIVSITAPSGSSATTTTTSSINFTASAYDSDGAVQSVEFFANGYSLGQAVRLGTTSTWRLVNDFSLLGAGTYAITAVATDDDDNRSSSAPLSLVVTGALSAAPTINLTASATSVATGQEITLFAATSDPDGTVTRVQYYANGALIDARTSAPFTGLWRPTVAGSYQLEAIATDNSGNTTVSNSLTIAVGSNSSPVATLIVPTTTVTSGSPLPLGLQAGDIDGAIYNVTFYANGATISSGFDLSASWTPTLPGSYRLVARVEDDSGNVVFTPEVAVTVKPESGQRPVASLNLRAANSEFPPKYTQGSSVVISAVASDQDGSVASVILSVNGRTLVSRTEPPFTATYTFKSTDVGYVNFAAIVQDNDGNIQVASADALVYSLSKEVPVLQITAPASDTTLTRGSSVVVTAEVGPIDEKLESVQILQNGRLLASFDKAPYSTTLTLDSPGTVELRAVAFYENPFYRLQPNPDGSTTRVDFDIAAAGISAARTLTVVAPTGTPPTVSISSPVAGSTLTTASTLNLSASAFDSDGTVASVEFFANGTSVGFAAPISGSTLWRLPFSFGTMGTGTYTMTAIATDSSGNRVLSAPVAVTVTGATSLPPTASLSASDTAVSRGQEITFSASASDPDGIVVSVDFYVNGSLVGTATAPYHLTWTPTVDGIYRAEAIATDNTGNTRVSNMVAITVGENADPVATLIVPVTTMTRGSSLPIGVDAGDIDGTIASVQFFANGAPLSLATERTATWTPAVAGVYRLIGKVTDSSGNVAFTPEVLVTVVPEVGLRPAAAVNLRPSLDRIVTQHYSQGSSVVINTTASDEDGAIASVVISVNGRTLATRTAPPYTATYTFTSDDVGAPQVFSAIVQDDDGNVEIGSTTATVSALSREVPTVVLTSPSADTRLTRSSTVVITAEVAPLDAELTAVQFLQNGRFLAEFKTPPYTTTLTLDTVGTVELRAVAYYSSIDGINIGTAVSGISSARTLTVEAAAGVVPTVSITSPTDGSTITTASTAILRATAFDSDGSINAVEFFANGTSVGRATQVPGSASWSLPHRFGNTGAGTYTLTALATDSSGNQVLSSPVAITVVGATSNPPTVSVTASTAAIQTGQTVTFTADAIDTDGTVVSVQFFADGLELGAASAAPFIASWTPSGAGTYQVYAIATDNTGNTTVSSSVTVTVTPNQLPTVAITSPVDGGFVSTGREITIFAAASDADGTVAKVEFFANGASIGSVNSSPYRINWTPGVAGDYALSVVATDNRGAVSSMSAPVNVFAAFEIRVSPLIDAGEFVNAAYADLLDRTPTTAEFDAAVARFSAIVPLTRAALVTELEATPEFKVRLQQIIAYKVVMGEWPTRDELQAAIDAAGGGTGGGSVGDDHGDTASTATTVNSSVTSGRIETWGDIDFFRINVTTAGTFTFSTSGSSDTVGTLYDSAGNVIAENDDAGSGWNFLITRSLTAGTYYVSVEGWMGFVTGSYRLNVTGPGFSNNGGPVEGTDLALTTFINNLFSSSAYLAKYGSVPNLNTAASRTTLFTQLFVNNYGTQPTDQQKLEGSTNLNALGNAATYVSYMATGTKISGRDLIYNAPDVSKQHLSAALILGLQRIRPVAADVSPLAALTPLKAAEAVLDDADYVNRYITVDNPPLSQTVAVGETLRLSVGARGSQPFSYQWYRNGSPLAGAISQFLTINHVVAANAGLYSVEITGPTISVFSPPAIITVGASSTKLVNISTRAQVGTGESLVIAGFIVSGDTPRQVLVRGAGPALEGQGVNNFVADPKLQLFRADQTMIAENDDWMGGGQAEEIGLVGARVGASTFADQSKDAALLITLEPGAYTAQLTGKGGTGIGLIDVFDTGGTGTTRALNVSTRARVGSDGEAVVIAGFVVKGPASRKFLIRAVGPSLAPLGVAEPLGNPRLTLYNQEGVAIYRNNDWAEDSDAGGIGAAADNVTGFGLVTGSKDAAMVVTLAPGAYTVHASSEEANGTGIVLIEVYDLER